jgi:hypothetical protein
MECTWCGKSLVAIGNYRKNGKPHNDWQDRKLHKKCWKTRNDAYFLHINDRLILSINQSVKILKQDILLFSRSSVNYKLT